MKRKTTTKRLTRLAEIRNFLEYMKGFGFKLTMEGSGLTEYGMKSVLHSYAHKDDQEMRKQNKASRR